MRLSSDQAELIPRTQICPPGDKKYSEMETKEQDGIADVTEEDVEQDHVERVIDPATSRGLPSVSNDFQPFEGENHLRSWR